MAGKGKQIVMLFGQRNRWSLLHLYEQEAELWDISNPHYSKKMQDNELWRAYNNALGILLLVGF